MTSQHNCMKRRFKAINMSTCQKIIWQVMTEICHHSIPIHLLHWYQKLEPSSIVYVVTCITIRNRKSTVLERLTVKVKFQHCKKKLQFFFTWFRVYFPTFKTYKFKYQTHAKADPWPHVCCYNNLWMGSFYRPTYFCNESKPLYFYH